MFDGLKNWIQRSIHYIPAITSVLVLGGFISAGAYYFYKNRSNIDIPVINTSAVVEQAPDSTESQQAADSGGSADTAKSTEVIKQNPPKTGSSSIAKKNVSTSKGTATVISTGGNSAVSSSKVQSMADEGPVSNIAYVDNTGQYPNLGETLKNYINSTLLHSTELSYLYEIDLVDCAECDYGGYWTGSYLQSGNDIYKAFGYITLNVGPYKTSPIFEDYMKLILSHEYGHHYTMYHRWVDLDISTGERFPAAYYSVRPLSYSGTATDYSLGWANCDAEIIAEDYSYFYSTYSYSGVASAHNYPSAATKNYLASLSGGSATTEETPSSSDTQAPSVAFSSPGDGSEVSGAVSISIDASDNVAVSSVDLAINGSSLGSDSSAPYQFSWNTGSTANGSYTLTATASDGSGNQSSASITLTVKNTVAVDNQKPTVTMAEPLGNPYSWTAEDLRLSASATDNVAVTKMEFYINDYLVAEEDAANILRIWRYAPTSNGSYVLKAKAYDAAGNAGEASITINKS